MIFQLIKNDIFGELIPRKCNLRARTSFEIAPVQKPSGSRLSTALPSADALSNFAVLRAVPLFEDENTSFALGAAEFCGSSGSPPNYATALTRFTSSANRGRADSHNSSKAFTHTMLKAAGDSFRAYTPDLGHGNDMFKGLDIDKAEPVVDHDKASFKNGKWDTCPQFEIMIKSGSALLSALERLLRARDIGALAAASRSANEMLTLDEDDDGSVADENSGSPSLWQEYASNQDTTLRVGRRVLSKEEIERRVLLAAQNGPGEVSFGNDESAALQDVQKGVRAALACAPVEVSRAILFASTPTRTATTPNTLSNLRYTGGLVYFLRVVLTSTVGTYNSDRVQMGLKDSMVPCSDGSILRTGTIHESFVKFESRFECQPILVVDHSGPPAEDDAPAVRSLTHEECGTMTNSDGFAWHGDPKKGLARGTLLVVDGGVQTIYFPTCPCTSKSS